MSLIQAHPVLSLAVAAGIFARHKGRRVAENVLLLGSVVATGEVRPDNTYQIVTEEFVRQVYQQYGVRHLIVADHRGVRDVLQPIIQSGTSQGLDVHYVTSLRDLLYNPTIVHNIPLYVSVAVAVLAV